MKGLTLLVCFLSVVLLSHCVQIPKLDDFRARWSDTLIAEATEADIEAEVKFGREVAARMLADVDGVENMSIQKYVNTVGAYLVQYSFRSEIDFYFWVIESDTVNAYAMPGGYIFVTTAAYEMMENEAELAGVLAHEIAHVQQKHIVNALDIRGVDSGATLTQLTSGASDAFRIALDQAAEQAVTLLTDEGLVHSDEFEADEIGLTIMVQAGYNPDAYFNYLNRVSSASSEKKKELNNTHPAFGERLSQLAEIKTQYGMENLDYALLEGRFSRHQLK